MNDFYLAGQQLEFDSEASVDIQPTANSRASDKEGKVCWQQHYSLTELCSYVSTYESGFLKGFRKWRGSILATQRSPEPQRNLQHTASKSQYLRITV